MPRHTRETCRPEAPSRTGSMPGASHAWSTVAVRGRVHRQAAEADPRGLRGLRQRRRAARGRGLHGEGARAAVRARAEAGGPARAVAVVPRRLGDRHLPRARLRRRAVRARRPPDGGRGPAARAEARVAPVPRRIALAVAAGLVLADSSIVTLALPEILRELDTTVAEVAWVLVSFNVALAVAAVPGAMIARRTPRTAMIAAVLVFAAACILCAEANGLSLLLTGRVVQGLAGAVVVAASLELLLRLDSEGAVGTWATAGVIGAAVGPAAGGILTDLLSWEAMFALQAPVALVALAGVVG